MELREQQGVNLTGFQRFYLGELTLQVVQFQGAEPQPYTDFFQLNAYKKRTPLQGSLLPALNYALLFIRWLVLSDEEQPSFYF